MAQMELLWAAAVLMLLGAAISLCVKCQLSASKREKQLSKQRSQLESQRRFEVIRNHSSATRRLELIKEPGNLSIARKTTKELSASCHPGYGSRSKTKIRYQNFLTEDRLQGDAVYVEPVSLDHYNCARFFTPPYEKEEDSHSYQNVIIGVSCGADPGKEEDTHSYQNVIIGVSCGSDPARRAESSDEEPDYVNTASVSGPPSLSKQSAPRKA
ncbi:linker for activation of T-cells family member 2 isoform X2 [Melanerpes formicivorus]|uniref:linker for activation of T-cells family member 2 isoform X2 n=1 Tax=Melanerpes formicivorus TaxID=211600 RepID=UPI00358EF75A